MIQTYALPCTCGKSVPVEVRQAGNQTTCSECNRALDVPRLRELKTLPRFEKAGEASPVVDKAYEPPRWSGLPGALFSLGLLMLVIACASAAYTYSMRSNFEAFAKAPVEEDIEFTHDIRQISLIDSWEAWGKFREINLSSRQQPYHVFAKEKIASLDKWLMFFSGLGTLGLLSMVVSFLARPRG
jgi:hypothetical protein